MAEPRRRICFVTGTRAEFGLMDRTLASIAAHPRLSLQIIATGMHLDRTRGYTLAQIRRDGWSVDATIPWRGPLAQATGLASAGIAAALQELQADVVLVVGDRVEALAGALAGHLSGRIVAHVHGGDRALGLVDDSLRHAITKLAHLHFPATAQSASRIRKLGEDPSRIHLAGSPGLDNIRRLAAPSRTLKQRYALRPREYALLLLHPVGEMPEQEAHRARLVLDGLLQANIPNLVILYPNNDPGSEGIVQTWQDLAKTRLAGIQILPHVRRPDFLGLMRDAAILVGNSSSGIIEAASFGTPVIDIGPRQTGREHSDNLVHVDYNANSIRRAAATLYNHGKPMRFDSVNVYGDGGANRRIAHSLARIRIDASVRQKLICY